MNLHPGNRNFFHTLDQHGEEGHNIDAYLSNTAFELSRTHPDIPFRITYNGLRIEPDKPLTNLDTIGLVWGNQAPVAAALQTRDGWNRTNTVEIYFGVEGYDARFANIPTSDFFAHAAQIHAAEAHAPLPVSTSMHPFVADIDRNIQVGTALHILWYGDIPSALSIEFTDDGETRTRQIFLHALDYSQRYS